MKIKYTFWLLLLLSLGIGAASCSKDSDGEGTSGISLSAGEQLVSELGGSFTVELSAASPWVSRCDDWLTVSPENGGAGTHTITVVADAKAGNTVSNGKVIFTLADQSASCELLVTRGSATAGRRTDSLALVSLYNATKGDKWKIRWNLNRPMSTWEQVQLESIDGEMRVTEVMLVDFGLEGTLPDAIKYMDKLRYFSVENNKLTGNFPEFLCEMKQLELIVLGGNNFKGEVPSAIYDLENLVFLVLQQNQFTGTLPENLGNCKSLKTLYINDNDFEGPIPASFSQLRNLAYVQVYNNRFEGALPDFSAMDSLVWVEFSRCGEYKEVYETCADNEVITRHEYVSGGFTGEAPHFKNKTILQSVAFSENHLTSSPKFTNCPELKLLYISQNPLGTLDPSATSGLPKLETIHAAECGFTALPDFSGCPALKFLYLNYNQLTELPESVSTLTALEELYVEGNQLRSFPEGISAWQAIRHIRAGYNQLASLPEAIWSLPLYTLYVPCNQISNTLPENLYGMRNLYQFRADINQFQGTAVGLTTLTAGQDIRFSQNKLTGDFPTGFKNVTALATLTLDDNDLTGSIPSDIAQNRALNTFHIYGNRMSGDIPRSVLQSSKWCSWDPANRILPQRGEGFNAFQDPCN